MGKSLSQSVGCQTFTCSNPLSTFRLRTLTTSPLEICWDLACSFTGQQCCSGCWHRPALQSQPRDRTRSAGLQIRAAAVDTHLHQPSPEFLVFHPKLDREHWPCVPACHPPSPASEAQVPSQHGPRLPARPSRSTWSTPCSARKMRERRTGPSMHCSLGIRPSALSGGCGRT